MTGVRSFLYTVNRRSFEHHRGRLRHGRGGRQRTQFRASQDRQALEAVFSSSVDGLWLIDHTGTVLMVNQGAERIHQLDRSQMVGKTVEQLAAMKVMDRSVTLEVFRHRKSLTINQTLPRLDKEILVTATPVFDEQGALRYVVVLDRDMTELARLKRQLMEMKKVAELSGHPLPLPLENAATDQDGIVVSPAMKQVYRQAMQAAATRSTILLTDESGVGKGFLAGQIHKASGRRRRPFVHLNCGALPQSLIDAELFGYVAALACGYLFFAMHNPRWTIPIRTGEFFNSTALTFEHAFPLWLVRTFAVLGGLLVGLAIPYFFCRFMCPTGGVLAVPGKFSLFKYRLTASCTDCGNCDRACGLETRPGRDNCTNCGDCKTSCPTGAIEIGSLLSR